MVKHLKIRIHLNKSDRSILAQVARYEKKSISDCAQQLILEALEDREDRALSRLAEQRDASSAKRIKHSNKIFG